jgi:hypothetical protein
MVMTMYDIPHTVVETDPFLERAADIWTEEERTEFWAYAKGTQEDLTPKGKILLSKFTAELKSTNKECRKAQQS